jgi:DNA-binding CsgD family transcriptional regulator
MALFGLQHSAEEGMYPMNSSSSQQDLTALWSAGMQALESLGIGWLVCDETGRLLVANRIASRILNARDGLRLNSKGVPCATTGRPEVLAEAFERAAATTSAKQGNRRTAFIVKRANGKRPLTLLAHSVVGLSTKQNFTQSATCVLILDPARAVQPTASDLRQLYGFTPRETGLAALLMDGSTLDESCYRLGMSGSTGRTHLRRLFKKVGVHRQSELVSVLLKTIGMLRLRDEGTRSTQLSGDRLDPAVIWAALPDQSSEPGADRDQRRS